MGRGSRIAVVGLVVAACVRVGVNVNSYPTPPAPGWQVVGSPEVGVVVALPPGWRTFDLQGEVEAAAAAWGGGDAGKGAAALIEIQGTLVPLGHVRFFAASGGSADVAVLYAGDLPPPDGGLEGLLELSQRGRRPVLEHHRFAGRGGDTLAMRISDDAPSVGGPAIVYQYAVIVKQRLRPLIIHVPRSIDDAGFAPTAELIGRTYTPFGS